MLPKHPKPSPRTKALWRSRLGSALRTMLASAVVALAKFFGPVSISRYVEFPTLSYVTAILITSEATLGEALRGAIFALYGTIQGALPAILSLWLIGPARFSTTTTTLAVALSGFVVALPESSHVITKRIALVQIVVVYVVGFIQGGSTKPIMHPVHVAASSGLGALASVVALVIPFPRLGSREVREKSKLFSEIASEKLKLFVSAFCAENNTGAVASISQANSLGHTGTKLLQSIELKQESIQWEQFNIKPPPHFTTPSNRFHAIEIPMKGMEIALNSCSTFPITMVDQELKDLLHSLTEQISITLGQLKQSQHSASSAGPKTTKDVSQKSLQPLQVAFPTRQDLPSFFFLFCMKLLHDEVLMTGPFGESLENKRMPIEESTNSPKQEQCIREMIASTLQMRINSKRVTVAFKISLSLGLSVFFGLLFSKQNGFWAGITIALGFVPQREPTYQSANIRAQGTVLGSVYGILVSFISERFIEFRLLALLPWFVFTSFLSRSRMYSQAGGISAAIAAILILGRKNYGLPMEFAINRTTETFIGLCCYVLVELLLQPIRASTLAKSYLSESFHSLHEYLDSMEILTQESKAATCLAELKEQNKKLRQNVNELGKYIEEAEVEPNFWFLPFPSACYNKLLGSMSKMMDLQLYGFKAMEFLLQDPHRFGVAWKELQEHINEDLELCKSVVGSSLKCFEEVTRIKSLKKLEMELQRNNNSDDLESRKSPYASVYRVLSADEEDLEKIVGSFLLHAKMVMTRIHVIEGGDEVKSQVVLCLSALAFCIEGLMKETREMEKGIIELVQWENPSSHINLYEISCKVNDLST